MSTQLRAGIVGLGILGRQYAEFLSQHASVELVAVTDLRTAVAQELAARFGAVPCSDVHGMLKQHSLDLVVVATPDPAHREPTIAAITAGVPNIIQEKPLATTRADAHAIWDAVERHGARLFINYANRAAPLDKATHYVMQRGLLGAPIYGEVRLDDNISVPTALWGDRSRTWAAGSSVAHFLLSHVVDLLRWYFAPAEVVEVFAVSRQAVLGDTPDLYDAFLCFDTGLKIRAKAEWIKHMDELVEFYLAFTGSQGTLIYNKLPGFGTQPGWRANLPALSVDDLLHHQRILAERGTPTQALIGRHADATAHSATASSGPVPALQQIGLAAGASMALVSPIIDAIIENSAEPSSWQELGPLPNHVDGLRQTEIVLAIEESSQRGEPVEIPR
jgi:predicted dehydrogenase